MNMTDNTNICAISTPAGCGAIGIVRLSGNKAVQICESVFCPATKGKILSRQKTGTVHLGIISEGDRIIDEVLVSIFRAPHSYTGEDMTEISCHGSVFIQKEILKLLVKNGARVAKPGEFTLRAFLNGKLDLSQAEGVADLISAGSEAAHRLAIQQMRGGFSKEINNLRNKLLNFTSLIELELDFSEEDVEFADRAQLKELILEISRVVNLLIRSFDLGNVIKKGVPVVIAGEPNTGKSTLLNCLLREERSIVTDIAGTTRDYIEDKIIIEGILFRFIDTAGIRKPKGRIESIGIEQTYRKISEARIIILLVEANSSSGKIINVLNNLKEKTEHQEIILAINKTDLPDADKYLAEKIKPLAGNVSVVAISAKNNENIDILTSELINILHLNIYHSEDIVVTNSRHYEALAKTGKAIGRVITGLDSYTPGDLLAQDIREALQYLGEITGEITTEEVLGNIFKNFCIGK
jgi:tRNA modification GTPase